MAFPITKGSDPITETILADQWTKVATAVDLAKITNLSKNKPIIYFYYTATATPVVPADLNVEKEILSNDYDDFNGAGTDRELYLYPIGEDAKIRMEA